MQLFGAGESPAALQPDAAHAQEPFDLTLSVAAGSLVGGDSVLVEPAGLRSRIVESDIVSRARQRMRTGESRRARADHRYAPAACRGTLEYLIVGTRHQPVHRVTLQPPDLHRSPLLRVAHADLLAQHLGRTIARAESAQRIGPEDRLSRAACVRFGYASDEGRYVDARGTGLYARRVETVQAPAGFQYCLRVRERWHMIGEIRGVGVGRQASRTDIRPALLAHPRSPPRKPRTSACIGLTNWSTPDTACGNPCRAARGNAHAGGVGHGRKSQGDEPRIVVQAAEECAEMRENLRQRHVHEPRQARNDAG